MDNTHSVFLSGKKSQASGKQLKREKEHYLHNSYNKCYKTSQQSHSADKMIIRS